MWSWLRHPPGSCPPWYERSGLTRPPCRAPPEYIAFHKNIISGTMGGQSSNKKRDSQLIPSIVTSLKLLMIDVSICLIIAKTIEINSIIQRLTYRSKNLKNVLWDIFIQADMNPKLPDGRKCRLLWHIHPIIIRSLPWMNSIQPTTQPTFLYRF